MNYTVRTITIEELEKLNPLFVVDDYTRFIKERAERMAQNDIDIYVLEDNNKFIGEITIVYNHKIYEDYTIPNKRVYMEALRVLEEYQSKGIGQYLLEEVINRVREQGYSEITIGVEDDNENAKHIFILNMDLINL